VRRLVVLSLIWKTKTEITSSGDGGGGRRLSSQRWVITSMQYKHLLKK